MPIPGGNNPECYRLYEVRHAVNLSPHEQRAMNSLPKTGCVVLQAKTKCDVCLRRWKLAQFLCFETVPSTYYQNSSCVLAPSVWRRNGVLSFAWTKRNWLGLSRPFVDDKLVCTPCTPALCMALDDQFEGDPFVRNDVCWHAACTASVAQRMPCCLPCR